VVCSDSVRAGACCDGGWGERAGVSGNFIRPKGNETRRERERRWGTKAGSAKINEADKEKKRGA